MKRRVVVIGGGVIGLSIAWRLAERGHGVTVLERNEPASESSGVAGGMLTLAAEADPHTRELTPLRRASARAYPSAIEELEAASGMDVGFATSPALHVAFSAFEMDRMREHLGDAVSQDLPARWLDAAEARAIEPTLSPRIAGALLFPKDGVVDPRRLTLALAEAARRAGAEVRGHCAVERVVVGAERIGGIEASGETVRADAVVLAAGAWSGSIAGLPSEAVPPIRPVRGQILTLAAPQGVRGVPLPEHVVRSMEGYLVPHADGRIAIGATSEEKGFVKEVTVEGMLGLLRAAYEMVPSTAELALRTAECGLRPASRDGLPILGPSPVPGLFYATGHFRSGILLWTATADALVAWIEEREPDEAARGFSMERFAQQRKTSRTHPPHAGIAR